jgi:hypothetical protein
MIDMLKSAKAAKQEIASLSAEEKNLALNEMADALVAAEEGAESYDVLYDLMMANEPVDLVMGVPTNITNDGVPEAGWTAPTKGYTGKALITSLERTDSNGSNSTMTATFRGVGKLSKLA